MPGHPSSRSVLRAGLLCLLLFLTAASPVSASAAEEGWKVWAQRAAPSRSFAATGKAAADAPREFAPGWTVAGTLEASAGGVTSDTWSLVAAPGSTVTVAVAGEGGGVDLAVADPAGGTVLGRANAGSGDGSVTFTVPAGGRARVVVLDLASTGTDRPYRLNAEEAGTGSGSEVPMPGEPMPGEPAAPGDHDFDEFYRASSIRAGDTRRGELTSFDGTLPSDDSPVDIYRVAAEPGTRLEANLTSSDFDAYLLLVNSDRETIARNDDADGTNSRLRFTVPASGPVFLMANTYGADGRGAYALSLAVTDETAPVEEDPRFAPQGRVAVGETVDGRLDGDSARHPRDGAAMDVWTLELRAGQRVTIDATSEEIDTFLVLLSGGGAEQLASDDDGGEDTNARLAWTARSDGPVRVVVRPYGETARGAYRLSVTARGGRIEAAPVASGGTVEGVAGFARIARPLPEDGRVASALDASDARLAGDGSRLEVYAFRAAAGERVEVVMDSDAFDTYLHLASPDLDLVLARDDDSGGGTDARIEFTLPGAGEYLVVANGYDASASGPYELVVRRRPAQPSSDDPRRALLVGINDYVGVESDLTAPVLDALEMRTLLIDSYGYAPENIELLTDGAATRERILEAISRHLGGAPVDGSALFFYSGHGLQLDDVRMGDATERDRVDEALYLADDSMLLDDELAALTRALPAERVAVILDSCYSGGGFRALTGRAKGVEEGDLADAVSRPDKRADAKVAPSGGAVLEIAASREDQLSWQYSRWPDRREPLSVFTYYLIEALRDDALTSGSERFADTFGRLGAQTTGLTQRAFDRRQDPILSSSRPGTDLLDVLRP